ncbi:hypothetical protein [Hephaestia mangrovi]|uniref:hypothetical protein n=1 Tax=Hephaestia mangrovi TaxID=2873268 RepID=UPI001CA7810F|nr:hypothetical protein [Hephaestia mangrovi]
MMRTLLISVLCLYGTIKFCHVQFGRKRALSEDESGVTSAVKAGEPTVLLLALSIAFALNLYWTWWYHRLGAREVARATTCYALLSATHRLPGYEANAGVGRIEPGRASYMRVAIEHGAWIGVSAPNVRAMLAGKRSSFEVTYAALARQRDWRGVSLAFVDMQHCLNDQWAPHGEMFNP